MTSFKSLDIIRAVAKKEIPSFKGTVEEALPNLLFRVNLDMSEDGERQVLAHLSGKMNKFRIRVVPGDIVLVEMPDTKGERGRIVRRF